MLFSPIILYIFTLSTILLFLRIRHPFWSKQPVFHLHTLLYGWWWFPRGILYPSGKVLSKRDHTRWMITDRLRYRFIHPSILKSYETNMILDLLDSHYLKDQDANYSPTLTNFESTNNDPNTRFSLYYGNILDGTDLRKIYGLMTTRPLHIRKFNHESNQWIELKAGYVDYLCIHSKYRKQGIAEKMIYTHFVHSVNRSTSSSKSNKSNKHQPITFLFKREGHKAGSWWQMGVVPASSYMATGITLSQLSTIFRQGELFPNALDKKTLGFPILPKSYSIVESNIAQFQECMRIVQLKTVNGASPVDNKPSKMLLLCSSLTSISKMLETKTLMIHILQDDIDHQPLAMYVWKQNEVEYDLESGTSNPNPNLSIELQSAVWLSKSHIHDLFYSGFRESVATLAKSLKWENALIWLEHLADVGFLVRSIRQEMDEMKKNNIPFNQELFQCPMAYTWYNFVDKPVQPECVVSVGL